MTWAGRDIPAIDGEPMILLRRVFLALAAAVVLVSCATTKAPSLPPIVFVHGNGDTAALWMTTLWRFESNGWPRDRLYRVEHALPAGARRRRQAARGPHVGRRPDAHLAAEVDQVLQATGAHQVVLVGNSRGGNAIRDYIANGGGATQGVARHPRRHAQPRCVVQRGIPPRQRVQRSRSVPECTQCTQRRQRRRGHARRRVDDDPLRQQRQVRAARRRVDRRQGHAD